MKRTHIIILIIALVVIALIILGVLWNRSSLPFIDQPGVTQNPGDPSPTWKPAEPDLKVPEQGEQNLPDNVAAPSIVAKANPTTDASFRGFAMKAENGKFTPDTVIVKVGDTTHIDLTAVDSAIDFTQPDYGFFVNIAKGETKVIELGATAAGKFIFFCKSCGGPEKGPIGYLQVVPK